MIPQVIFFIVIFGIAVLCIFDFQLVVKMFHQFIDWVKIHPYQSIGYSIYVLAFSVIFTIPISYTIMMLGYTYT